MSPAIDDIGSIRTNDKEVYKAVPVALESMLIESGPNLGIKGEVDVDAVALVAWNQPIVNDAISRTVFGGLGTRDFFTIRSVVEDMITDGRLDISKSGVELLHV